MIMSSLDNWTNTEAPQPTSTPDMPSPRRRRRLGTRTLLALALATGGVGGGVAGTALTAHWLTPQAAQATLITPQPISQSTSAAPANVAGAVLKSVGPSVVEVDTSSSNQAGRRQFSASGIGSGFVINTSGLILTNNHVVDGATSVTVKFSTGATRTATVVGTDSADDLALIRVSNMPAGIAAVQLADSSQVAVGETAIAIGTPFGLDETVTQGIISAVNRTWSTDGELLRGLLQTDAPINPGNSGGPLLDAQGQVIGINTMIESPVEGNVGVGFAVPSNTIKQQLVQLEAGTNVQQGYLGVSVQDSTGANQQGVTIADVSQGSGAAQAGLQAGDVVTAVDGKAVTDYASLANQIGGKQPGAKVTVTIVRNGQQRQVVVTLQAQTAQPAQQTQPAQPTQ